MFNYLEKKYLIAAAAVVIAVIVLGAGVIIYKQQNPQSLPQNPNNPQVTQEEVKRLVQEVGKLIELPAGEIPTVATVTDVDKLKSQTFFQNAKNGDKVLIYSGTRKAILYSPSLHKVIDVVPINLGTSSAQPATSPQPQVRSPQPSPVASQSPGI